MASAKTWFVQTGFGTVLGPMPDDALQEMVRTGALVRSDQVREGAAGEWHPASETAGLFEAVNSVVAEVASEAVTVAEPSIPAPPVTMNSPALAMESVRQTSEVLKTSEVSVAKGRLIPPPAPTVSVPLNEPLTPPPPELSVAVPPPTSTRVADSVPAVGEDRAAAESPNKGVPVIRSTPPKDDMLTRWREERDRSLEELGTVSLAAEMAQSHDEEDFVLKLSADLLDNDKSDKSILPSVSVLAGNTTRRREIHRPAFLDQVIGLKETPQVREETAAQKRDRWRRSLPNWQIAAGLMVVVLAAWWFWPSSSRGIYHRYVAIWNEWKTCRDNLKDQAGWQEFLQRTERELNATVPYLEEHARTSDREKQLLLFLGRDCLQKMLENPKQIGTPQEKQLQILFANLQEFYQPSASGKQIEPVVERSSRQPRKTTARRMIGDSLERGASGPLKTESPSVRSPPTDVVPEAKPLDAK